MEIIYKEPDKVKIAEFVDLLDDMIDAKIELCKSMGLTAEETGKAIISDKDIEALKNNITTIIELTIPIGLTINKQEYKSWKS